MSDSYYMGDDVGDDLGDLIGDLVGDDEVGARRRVQRVAKRHGMVAIPKAKAAQLQHALQNQAVDRTAQTGVPTTVGGKLAASSQRLEVLPIGSIALAAAAASTASLSVNVQRPIQPYRLILQCADSTTGADQLFSVGISNIVLGAHNLFASPGVMAPATGFSRDAWGTEILTVPMLQGGVVRVDLQRLAAVANPGVAAAMLLGFAAST
jgi:hypothetical protein